MLCKVILGTRLSRILRHGWTLHARIDHFRFVCAAWRCFDRVVGGDPVRESLGTLICRRAVLPHAGQLVVSGASPMLWFCSKGAHAVHLNSYSGMFLVPLRFSASGEHGGMAGGVAAEVLFSVLGRRGGDGKQHLRFRSLVVAMECAVVSPGGQAGIGRFCRLRVRARRCTAFPRSGLVVRRGSYRGVQTRGR